MNEINPIHKDSLGRSFKKLRLSLLDACNYRCFYCMPEDSVKFTPKEDWLNSDELFLAVKKLTKYGIDEVRATGGEPTLRPDFVDIMERLSDIPLKKLGITTNGHLLYNLLPEIKERTNVTSINISLDSLIQEKFKRITQVDGLENVLKSIYLAKELGFNVKINTVAIRGFNDDEIFDFLEFGKKLDIDIRFLELMKIGVMEKQHHNYFITADEIINKIQSKHVMTKIESDWDSTSINYRFDNVGKVGFIASETKQFCSTCTRLRLGAKGDIRPCIMLPESINMNDLSEIELENSLKTILALKPMDRIESQADHMYRIGG